MIRWDLGSDVASPRRWVGMGDLIRRTTSAEIDLPEMTPFIPTDFEMPPGGLNLRWPDDRYDQDRRLRTTRALPVVRRNKVNRITMDYRRGSASAWQKLRGYQARNNSG